MKPHGSVRARTQPLNTQPRQLFGWLHWKPSQTLSSCVSENPLVVLFKERNSDRDHVTEFPAN